MTSPLIPERFGCGLKLPLAELRSIRARIPAKAKAGDFALTRIEGPTVASSIDKVFAIPTEPERFCRIALLHVAADIKCGGARAEAVDVCFEFGNDLDAEGRASLSLAFYEAAEDLGLKVGKCHSTYGPTTALTIAVLGAATGVAPRVPNAGHVLISRRLGALNELYLQAIESSPNYADAALIQMATPQDELTAAATALQIWMTDVSGFGLAGAVVEMAELTGRQLRLSVGNALWLRDDFSGPLLPCLQADAEAMPSHWVLNDAQRGAVLARELCGPFILLCDETQREGLCARLPDHGAELQEIGTFNADGWGADLSWT